MRIAHISDLHLVATPPGGLIRADAVARAQALLADIMAFRPAVDLVVITGDNVNDGRAEEYRLLADLLADLTIPFVILPGNHDERPLFRTTFPGLPYAAEDRLYYEHRQGHVRVLALDSHVPGAIHGALDAPQLDWLDQRLAEGFAGTTLVAIHHPPCTSHMGKIDGNILNIGADRLGAILGTQPRPVAVLCGHHHRPITALWQGSIIFAAPSTAFQFALSLEAPSEPDGIDEPFSYAIHLIDVDGAHVVHRRSPGL